MLLADLESMTVTTRRDRKGCEVHIEVIKLGEDAGLLEPVRGGGGGGRWGWRDVRGI